MTGRSTWRGWFSRPRRRLNWRVQYRIYIGVVIGDVVMLWFGVTFALWPQEPSDRWAGVVLLVCATALNAFLVAYLRRPAPAKSHRGW